MLNLQCLELRRNIFDALMAFDIFIYARNVNDVSICSKIVPFRSRRVTRHVWLVNEIVYRHDYLFFQPIARMRRILNEHREFIECLGSRLRFKSKVIKKLNDSMWYFSNYIIVKKYCFIVSYTVG